MAATATAKAAAPAIADRVSGQQPSRLRSLLVAGMVGTTAAVVTYRLLRSAPAGGRANDE
jgi:hypothetical protein